MITRDDNIHLADDTIDWRTDMVCYGTLRGGHNKGVVRKGWYQWFENRLVCCRILSLWSVYRLYRYRYRYIPVRYAGILKTLHVNAVCFSHFPYATSRDVPVSRRLYEWCNGVLTARVTVQTLVAGTLVLPGPLVPS